MKFKNTIITSVDDLAGLDLNELKVLHMNREVSLNIKSDYCYTSCKDGDCECCHVDGKIISIMDEMNFIKKRINELTQ